MGPLAVAVAPLPVSSRMPMSMPMLGATFPALGVPAAAEPDAVPMPLALDLGVLCGPPSGLPFALGGPRLGPWPAGLVSPRPGPPFGMRHRFHGETARMGTLSEDRRAFTKQEFKGRLSVVTESEVHSHGVLQYAVQFTRGELSNADGVGFIFSPTLPCPKNIQRIVSIFANRTGRICVRAHAEVVRSDVSVKRLEIGDWLSVTIDLDKQIAEFVVWPVHGGTPSSARFAFGEAMDTLRFRIPGLPRVSCGFIACVVKHLGVAVTLGS